MLRKFSSSTASAGRLAPAAGAFHSQRAVQALPLSVRSFSVLVLSLSIAGMAAEKEKPVELPGVVVTPADELGAGITSADFSVTPVVARSTAKLSEHIANFHVAGNDAHSFNDTFALRGMTNTPLFGAPAVAVYLDHVPLSVPFAAPAELGGFERATLHRGSAHTTKFGRAGSAGALVLHTPESGEAARGELRATAGSFDARSVSAEAASARSRTGDAYVSAQWSRRDGYIENVTLGDDIDYKDSRSVIGRLRIRPAPETELTLLVTGMQARDGVQPLVPLGAGHFTVARTTEGETAVEAGNVGLAAVFPAGANRVLSVTSASAWRLAPYHNTLAFGPAELGNDVELRQRALTQEFRIAAEPGDPLHWQGGAFVSTSRTTGAFARDFSGFTFERSRYEIAGRDAAIFAEIGTELRGIQLDAGLRMEATRREMDRTEEAPAAQQYSLEEKSTALLPRLSARKEILPGTHVLAAVGGGYKPGGFSAFTGNRQLAAFGPERIRMVEADLTHVSADRKWTATLRLFHYAITGYQIERSFATGGSSDDYLVLSAPEARSEGGEIEVTWKPARNWIVAADFGVTEVKLRDFTDPFTGTNLDGSRAPYVPDFDGSLRVDFRPALGFFGGVALQREGRIFYTEDENEAFAQPPRTLWAAHCGYAGSRVKVTVFGENLTDERYYRAISPGTGHATPGVPRTFGVELALHF